MKKNFLIFKSKENKKKQFFKLQKKYLFLIFLQILTYFNIHLNHLYVLLKIFLSLLAKLKLYKH